MKAIAAEVGLDPALVERAARLTPAGTEMSRFESVLGGPLKFRFRGHSETRLTDENAAHLLHLIRAAAEQKGDGEANAAGLSWHSVGEGSQIIVAAHPKGTGTRFSVVVDRRTALALTGMFTGLGSLAVGVAVLAVGEAAGLQSIPIGLTIMGTGVAGVVALGRTVWAATSRRVRERAAALMETLSTSLDEFDAEGDTNPDAGEGA